MPPANAKIIALSPGTGWFAKYGNTEREVICFAAYDDRGDRVIGLINSVDGPAEIVAADSVPGLEGYVRRSSAFSANYTMIFQAYLDKMQELGISNRDARLFVGSNLAKLVSEHLADREFDKLHFPGAQ